MQRVLEQEREHLRLKKQLAQQVADKEAEKEQIIYSIKESLMQEVKVMVAQSHKQDQLAAVSKLRHRTIMNVYFYYVNLTCIMIERITVVHNA